MADEHVCPSCGFANAPGATSCAQCNFPFEVGRPAAPDPGAQAPRGASTSGGIEPEIIIRRPLRRPTRRPPAMTNQQLALWLMFAVFAAAAVIYAAIQANLQRASQPVPGSNETQQKQADDLRAALQKDSSSVDAHIELANILYDTGNWSDAIVQYRAALRRDSTRVGAMVDLGVCYYNLSSTDEAERLFRLALARDPRQPVALFNLGIVSERAENYTRAMDFFHRALEAGPGEDIRDGIVQAMKRIQQKTGRSPGPLPGVAPESTATSARP